MSGTITTDKKSDKKAQDKAQKGTKSTKAVEPVEVEAKGADVDASTQADSTAATETKPKRSKKNTTATVIDPSNVESGRKWLSDFTEISNSNPPTKGYDQHVNAKGFVHATTAQRIPNDGAANMVTLIGDILAKREAAGDATAGLYIDYCINFLTSHRDALQAERDAAILAEAEAIRAKQKKS
jgi:hypothetical protein